MQERTVRLNSAVFGFIGAGAFMALFHGGSAAAQNVKEFIIRLQETTPGFAQTGHMNITGVVRSGSVISGEMEATALNGSAVEGWNLATTGVNYGGHFQSFSASGRGVNGVASASTGANFGGTFTSLSTGGTGVIGLASASSGATMVGSFQSASTTGIGAYGLASSPTGAVRGGMFEANSSAGIGVYGQVNSLSGDTTAGYFLARSNSGKGVFGHATSASGLTIGGSFRADSTTGTAVQGLATASSGLAFGGIFTSQSTGGQGVWGNATATTGATYGVRGHSNSASGSGVYGTSPDNVGVRGEATGTTDVNYGGYFQTRSSNGYGVFGFASATSGLNIGGFFRTDSSGGYGVSVLQNAASSGVTRGLLSKAVADQAIAVQGWSSATTVENYGIVGQTDSINGYGVYSIGDMAATGAKFFRIDHPLDPANKYLNHFCTEGAEPLNAYSGNVRTDSQGYATVELPEYLEAINKDFRYQLTVLDAGDTKEFVMTKVVRKVEGNTFVIRTSAPRVEVSWRLEGVRNDPYMRLHRRPVVQDKNQSERGTYQHPELYGKGPELSSPLRARTAGKPQRP